jgi:uncharacterized flavoprotein (TIGR03862 family)
VTLKKAAIIGAGPAGLKAADVLAQGGVQVDLFEAMPSAGRKFLVAGKGGLNLTHSEPFKEFLLKYRENANHLEPFLSRFGPDELRQWCQQLGVDTFVGSSGRVFPVGMKSFPILQAWIQRLKTSGVSFHFNHRWTGWDAENNLRFETPAGDELIQADVLVLALGGGSRPRLGSTGFWVPLLRQRGIQVTDLKSSNCGFDVGWTDYFRSRFDGQPVHPVSLIFTGSQGATFHQQGEFIITITGLEGSLVYAASALLRHEIEVYGKVEIHIDLAPDWTIHRLVERLSQPRGKRSISNHLKKAVSLGGVKVGLLWEILPKDTFQDPVSLAAAIKALPITLISPRPLSEAISSAGGISFDSLTPSLMLRVLPGVFCAGEMLDWEAPTGGYLLTACFSTGHAAGLSALNWLSGLTG